MAIQNAGERTNSLKGRTKGMTFEYIKTMTINKCGHAQGNCFFDCYFIFNLFLITFKIRSTTYFLSEIIVFSFASAWGIIIDYGKRS